MSDNRTRDNTISAIKWVSYAAIVASVLVLTRALPLGDGIAALRSWVDGLGVWGPIVFGLIYIVAVVAMLPASLLTLAAGATFGLLVGTITVSLASNIGAALAFVIARYLARKRVEQFVSERPRLAAIDRAIDDGGWKIVAMLRLSPAVPFNVQNYLYGLTSVQFWTCVLTSWVAMLPGTFLYVYLGHAAGSVTGGTAGKSPGEWFLLGTGLLATIAVTVYITRLAQRKLREQSNFGGGSSMDAAMDENAPANSAQVSGPKVRPSLKAIAIPAVVAILLGFLAAVTSFKPGLITKVATRWLPGGPPSVEMSERYAAQPDGPSFDHANWDRLLHQHVDADGWVDYDGLLQSSMMLDDYLKSLADAPVNELGRDERLTLLINAYNAFTVRLILDHWPLASIKDIPAAQRWADVRWNIGGNLWSLEQIEHQQIRPNFKEPRIHFALVCAAVGCPPLRNEAYATDQLEVQLDEQTRYVHSHDTWLKYEPANETVKLTALYDWYRGDFGQSAGTVLEFVAQYNPDVRRKLEAGATLRTLSLPYDWSINDVSNRQPR